MAKKVCRTSVALDEVQLERVQQAATRKDVSVGWVIRKALEEYLATEEQPDLFSSSGTVKRDKL